MALDDVLPDREELEGTYVVMPAFNEGQVILETAQRVLSLGVRLVVVDDCSTDDSSMRLRSLPVTVLRHISNLGQGAALQTGVEYAISKNAKFIVTFDADGQHDAADIPKLIHRLKRDNLDVVLGSRFLGEAIGIPASRKLLLKLALAFTRLTTGLQLTDVHNGLRAFRAEVAPHLQITQNRMAHASEILHNIALHRLAYAEVPVVVNYSDYSKAKGQASLGAIDILYELIIKRLSRK